MYRIKKTKTKQKWPDRFTTMQIEVQTLYICLKKELKTLLLTQFVETLTHLLAKGLFTFLSEFTGSVCFSRLCGKLQRHHKRNSLTGLFADKYNSEMLRTRISTPLCKLIFLCCKPNPSLA